MAQPIEPLYSQSFIDIGEGQPVILLHGVFGNVAMWRTTVQALKRDFRVLIPRLPLFEVPVHRANVENLVEILDEYIEWHQLSKVTLVGTDIGAQLALCYAEKHPAKVKNVVLSGASGILESKGVVQNYKRPSVDSVSEQVRDVFFKKDFATPRLVDRVLKTISAPPASLYLKVLDESSRKTDMYPVLNRIKIPVLIVWGLQDRLTPPEVALHIHDLVPFGTVKFIDQCGHLPMIEKAEVYASKVMDFLRQN